MATINSSPLIPGSDWTIHYLRMEYLPPKVPRTKQASNNVAFFTKICADICIAPVLSIEYQASKQKNFSFISLDI